MLPAALATAQLLTGGCIGGVSYPCQRDAQCSLGEAGACIEGYCAAVDDSCPSGYRFSEHSPGGAVCTPAGVADTGDTGGIATGGAASSSNDDGMPTQTGDDSGVDSGSDAVLESESDSASDSGGTTGCVAAIEAGGGHLCALLTDGRVQCFGDPKDPVVGSMLTPRRFGVTELSATALAVGNGHACVVAQGEDSGVPFCWGLGQSGSIGGAMSVREPIALSGDGLPEDPVTVAVSEGSSCFAAAQDFGCLGRLAPVVEQDAIFEVGASIVDLAAGRDHLCLVAGSVHCAGDNAFGQLGVLDPGSRSATPDGVAGVARVASSGLSTCAWMGEQGPLYCWGRNTDGQILEGSDDAYIPTAAGAANVRALAMSARTTCVADEAGDTRCIGDGSCGTSASSYAVTNPNANALDIAVTNDFLCVVDLDRQVRCWGEEAAVGALTGQPVVACDEFSTLPVECG